MGKMASMNELLEKCASISAEKKSIVISVYGVEQEDVEQLVKNEGYRLAAVCGSSEEMVRLVACKEAQEQGFKIEASIFSKELPKRHYLELRHKL